MSKPKEKRRHGPRHVVCNDSADRARAKRAAVKAVDAMIAGQGRPLTPPPMPTTRDPRTAGALALAREIRLGHYDAIGKV
jgi:hypothetical protein